MGDIYFVDDSEYKNPETLPLNGGNYRFDPVHRQSPFRFIAARPFNSGIQRTQQIYLRFRNSATSIAGS